MQRGWIKLNKKRYYLDEDGILQTGTLTIDGKKYTFAADGSIKKWYFIISEQSSRREN